MEKLTKRFSVIIVGGGIAGLALANALATSPHFARKSIALVDKASLKHLYTDPSKENIRRVVSLNPSSIQFLKDIGLNSLTSSKECFAFSKMKVFDATGSSHLLFDANNVHSDTIGYIVGNLGLQKELYQRLLRYPTVSIFDSIKEMSIKFDNYPKVSLNNGTTLTGNLLVGADGAKSLVREQTGINVHHWNYHQQAIVATLQCSGSENKMAYQRFLPTGPIAYLPSAKDEISLVWTLPSKMAQQLSKADPQHLVKLINGAMHFHPSDVEYYLAQSLKRNVEEVVNEQDDFGSTYKQLEANWAKGEGGISNTPFISSLKGSKVGTFPLQYLNSCSYISDRVALVGDAAHVVHPLAGQGINLGLDDTKALADILNRASYVGEDLGHPDVLLEYHRARYIENHIMAGTIDVFNRIFLRNDPWWNQLRGWGMSSINETPWLKNMIMQYAMGGNIKDVKSKN